MKTYKVWEPAAGDTEDSARTIKAAAPEDAVEAWAERDDRESAEYHIVGGASAEVVVLDVESGEHTEWAVTGESVPHYTAWRRT